MFGGNVDFTNNQATVDDMHAAMQPLAHYDDQKLRELLDSDLKTEEYILGTDLSTRKMMQSRKEMTMAQNKSLAEYNLSLAPQLENGKSNLKQLMQQIEEVRSSILRKQDQLKGTVSAETALALLQTSAAESEEHSEDLTNKFYQKNVEVEEFLEKFQDTRKNMHLRRVKAEKMVEILAQPNSRPGAGQARRAPPLPPYPIGPNSFFNHSS